MLGYGQTTCGNVLIGSARFDADFERVETEAKIGKRLKATREVGAPAARGLANAPWGLSVHFADV